jgi:hypothetical protein
VVIDTGPSFQTQRQEGAAALNELASRNPALMQVAGDLIMRAQDFPMAEQLADRLQKTLPPNLQDAEGGAEQQVAQLSAQMHQAQQQMMMMQQALQEAQQKLQVAESGQAKSQMEIQAKMKMSQMEAQLQDAKLQRDIEAKKQAFESDAEMKREQAVLQAHLDKEKFDQEHKFLREKTLLDAHLMLEKAKIDNETKEEIAELTAYVEMQKAGKDNPALTADVNADLGDDAKPKKKSRKKVTMVAPSGASYSGTIEDDLGE